ncbi:MAG: right-handed parallel beta-helix repeat-containing protein [Bacteroidetes bacterium]|nr:right-handed parallel beta-helix repeat-containing protein [Bacteroidota bacterium]
MKKTITLLVLFMICTLTTIKATNVAGVIAANTTWNLAGSPYIVTSFITVNNGVTLTVDAGVTVKFADAQYMLVYGTLNATSATFTSNNVSPVPGIWSYIQTGGTLITDVGSVIMNGCQVLYASSFNVYRGKANLTNTDLLNFNNNGVDVQANCRFKMTGGSINTNSVTAAASGYGIGGYSKSMDTISGVTIQHFQYGLYMRLNSVFDLTNTIITSCNWPIYYQASADLTLHGVNTLTGNTNSLVNLAFTNMTDTMTLPTISLPYYLPGSLTVQHGSWLTLQTGNTFKVGGNQYLYIYGRLDATGSSFTSANAVPVPGDWGHIQVGSGTVADSGRVTMNACQVQYAQQLYVYNGKASLTNCSLLNFLYHGAQISTLGTLNMLGGSMNTSSAWALANGCSILTSANAHSTLSGVTMQNTYYGLFLAANAGIDITNVTITGCRWPIWYAASADLTVHGTNIFTGNVNTAVNMAFTSLSDTITLPVLNIPYFFQYGMTINTGARMVVGSNNILKFQIGYALDVNGALVANANPGENIFFTSYRDDNWGGDTNNDGTTTAPAQSNWYGVRFNDPSNDATCLMRRCKVRYAGGGNTGGISMFNASPTIDLCDLSNNYYGVYMQFASNPVFSSNTIGSSQFTPIAMSFEANPNMPNNILSFSDNAYDAIGLIGGTLTANAVIIKRNVTAIQNITYLMLDQIIIPAGKTLTINKGIVIKSYSYAHRIIVDGTLTANATADSLITFTSSKDDNYGHPGDTNKDGTITSPAIGDWGGIVFDPGSTGILNYCRLKYASVWNYYFSTCSTSDYINDAGVGMIDASPTISNCEFKDLNYGISCYRVSNPVISNNDMINITYTPFCISGSSDPTFIGNTFTNVKWRAIGLLGGYVCQNGTIKKRDVAGYTNITYVLLADMTIKSGTNVNVEPGVVIKVNSCNLYVDGGFKTDGVAIQKVVFTSLKDDNEGNPFDTNGDGNATAPASGNWGNIKFRATSDDAYCKINYTTVKYGGSTGEGGITFENAGGQINFSTITDSYYYGIYVNGNSTPLVDNLVIQNSRLDPIAMSLLSNPTLTNITFSANGSKAIKIIEGTLSSDATLATRNVAGITNIAYIITNLTISTNAKLTIQPGVVIKFNVWYANISVLGHLIAKGLPGNKIYFTSYADDSKGGDSNNDGNASVPSRGDWGYSTGGINYSNHANDSLVNCEISYPYMGVFFSNAHAIVDNCVIQQVSDCGIDVFGSSNPDIRNCQFNNIQNSPIRLSMFSNPTFTNCTSLNVGRMALTVRPETYSQSAVVPMRDFGGYTNITYYMEGTCVINSGTTITIPAGIAFKSNGANGFTVNGRLNVMGISSNRVRFTDYRDDLVGNPPDMNQDGSATAPPTGGWGGTWITFNDVSNDSSIIQYTNLKYGNAGIAMTSASPTIDRVIFRSLNYGVDLNGVSQPKLDNSQFQDLQYYPIQLSLVSFPASILNNTITGSTYKVIKVRDETLTQDVSLAKQSFGGVPNISYLFGSYVVGTGATLTINPGVVCKFNGGGSLTVNKGLIAEGGFRADSNIVFTSIKDDFYGGDSNSDSTLTTPALANWNYIGFNDQALDPLCRLRHCILKYSNSGLNITSASPLVTYSTIANNYYGVYAAAASNPVFHNCDFDNNYYWSINNVNKSFVIDATNCWWGSNLGPIQTNTQGNGTSIQELVTTAVNYTPYLLTGASNPMMGDVSLNGVVQAFDASLVLQHVVGSITLNATQQQVADVSFAAGITAYDASLILQYVVGLIKYFPAELAKPVFSSLTGQQLVIGSANVVNGADFNIPLQVINDSGMVSADIKLHYDPAYLQLRQVTSTLTDMNLVFHNDSVNGILSIALAGTNALTTDTTLADVSFHAMVPGGNQVTTMLTADSFLANEMDQTAGVIPGSVTITDNTTGIAANSGMMQGKLLPVYPNPSSGNATLNYQLSGDNLPVTIEVFNMLGQKVLTLVNATMGTGKYTVSISDHGTILDAGSYFIRMTVNGYSQTQTLQIIR